MSFMTNLLAVKKRSQLRTLTLISVFLPLFFLTNCASYPKSTAATTKYALSEEEKVCLREFFRDLLFEDHGAYVLYGTKPMSVSYIRQQMTEAEETQQQVWLDSLSAEEKAKLVTRERYDFYENCLKWEKIKNRLPIRQYLFGKFPSHLGPQHIEYVFINIETTLRTLLEYYGDFRRELGFEFDPLQVVFEIENQDSIFWNAVLKAAVPLGILLGYGQDNAWFFKWRSKFLTTQNPKEDFMDSLSREAYGEQDILYPNPQHFALPTFISFGLYPNDKAIFAQYKRDQKKIKALYRSRDEVDVALEWLTR